MLVRLVAEIRFLVLGVTNLVAIGWRNLRQDPLRLVFAIGGVTFSVVLITCLIGMMFGMTRNASLLVDHCGAGLLVSSPNNKTFDFASPFTQRKIYQVLAVPGVEEIEEFNVTMSIWKGPEGGETAIQIVSFDLRGKMAPPLKMIEGSVRNLHNQDAVIIDRSAQRVLGNARVGDKVEILDRRAEVVGICQDMQSFSTIPMVFTSLRRGEYYAGRNGSEGDSAGSLTMYLLVKVAPGADLEQVRAAIGERVADVEVHTPASLSWRTRKFWLVETGMGEAFALVALLGLVVGGAVLSQTLMTLTQERLKEFAVLKALGAGMSHLARVVLEQGVVCGLAGLVSGMGLSLLIRHWARSVGTEVEISVELILLVTVMTLILSGCASLLSIARLRKIEPALVFQA